eukprot:m.98680 g.98680  ORF g.98680 m.98680 type:complete len:464 (+) comp16758_c0_seq2:1660-3051(+)
MELGAITDTLGVAAGASAPKSPSFPIQFVEATEFKKDETNCTLEDFVLNLQENMATLVFNEPVDLSSLDLSGITFSGDSLVSVSVYPIDAPFNVTGDRTKTITIMLSDVNAAAIKADRGIGSTLQNSFITISGNTVRDMSSNPNTPATVRASLLLADGKAPVLLSYTLDMNLAIMNLSFDDIMSAGSLRPGFITLLNANSSQSRALVNTTGSTVDGYNIVLAFGSEDLNALKSIRDLATGEQDTFLVMQSSAIEDPAGQRVEPVLQPLQAHQVVPDLTAPFLEFTQLDIGEGSLMVRFSEAVDIQTLLPSKITLQSQANLSLPGSESLVLDQHTPVIPFGGGDTTFLLRLTTDDLFVIRNSSVLAIGSNSSFISLLPDSAFGFEPLPVNLISDSTAIPIAVYLPDRTGPSVVSFILNMNSHTISFEFDEPIVSSSMNPFYVWSQDLSRTRLVIQVLQSTTLKR